MGKREKVYEYRGVPRYGISKGSIDRRVGCSGLVMIGKTPGGQWVMKTALLEKYSSLVEYVQGYTREAYINERGYLEMYGLRDGLEVRCYELKDKRTINKVSGILEQDGGYNVNLKSIERYLRTPEEMVKKLRKHKDIFKEQEVYKD